MVYIKRSVHSANMDLIFSIFVALFVVQWQPTYGYSLTNATDSGEFDIFIYFEFKFALHLHADTERMFGDSLIKQFICFD